MHRGGAALEDGVCVCAHACVCLWVQRVLVCFLWFVFVSAECYRGKLWWIGHVSIDEQPVSVAGVVADSLQKLWIRAMLSTGRWAKCLGQQICQENQWRSTFFDTFWRCRQRLGTPRAGLVSHRRTDSVSCALNIFLWDLALFAIRAFHATILSKSLVVWIF